MPEEKKGGPASAQLIVSLVILGAVLLLRLFFPDATRSFLREHIAGGVDYTAVLSEVGSSLRGFFLGIPNPSESGQETENTSPAESGQKAGQSSQDNTDINPVYDHTPEDTYDPENEPPPDGIGGFDQPVFYANEEYFESFPDGGDDTLPLPFGMSKPDSVDFTVYELPFETVTPVEGRFTSGFGYRIHPVYGDWRFHYGIDIAANTGTAVYAFAEGIVAAVGVSASYGNYIILEHAEGYLTLYAHCKTILAGEGQAVTAGQNIATVGSTGVTTGPHLHFEIRRPAEASVSVPGGALEYVFLDPAKYVCVSED